MTRRMGSLRAARPALFGLAVLLASLCAGFGCARGGSLPSSLLPPAVTLADLQPLETTLFEQRLQVALRVRNANDVALPVRGIRYTLHVDGKLLAQGASEEHLTVPALADELITTTATTTSLALVRQLRGLSRDAEADYALSGALFLVGRDAPLPFEQAGEFDLWDEGEPAP